VAERQDHATEMHAALECEREAQRLWLAGEHARARAVFVEAAAHYRASWELASATSYGRLIGLQKAAILAGGGDQEARYVKLALAGLSELTPAAAYALALAALVLGERSSAEAHAQAMRPGGEAFVRTARAIEALAEGQAERYAAAVAEILADFERRREHLTGVPIADTALMLQELARRAGIAAELKSSLLGNEPAPAGGAA
jgi:hypothetical protein